jgi:uncharacterized protein (UPF0332 family)
MTEKQDYIDYKLVRSEDAIKSAEVLINEKLWLDALSKIYYAAFYIVSSLLINMKLNPKTHSGAKNLFHKEFILTGIIDKDFGKLYDTLLAKRFEADYEDFAIIDEEDIPPYLEAVKEFLIKAKIILQNSNV